MLPPMYMIEAHQCHVKIVRFQWNSLYPTCIRQEVKGQMTTSISCIPAGGKRADSQHSRIEKRLSPALNVESFFSVYPPTSKLKQKLSPLASLIPVGKKPTVNGQNRKAMLSTDSSVLLSFSDHLPMSCLQDKTFQRIQIWQPKSLFRGSTSLQGVSIWTIPFQLGIQIAYPEDM